MIPCLSFLSLIFLFSFFMWLFSFHCVFCFSCFMAVFFWKVAVAVVHARIYVSGVSYLIIFSIFHQKKVTHFFVFALNPHSGFYVFGWIFIICFQSVILHISIVTYCYKLFFCLSEAYYAQQLRIAMKYFNFQIGPIL